MRTFYQWLEEVAVGGQNQTSTVTALNKLAADQWRQIQMPKAGQAPSPLAKVAPQVTQGLMRAKGTQAVKNARDAILAAADDQQAGKPQ